MKVSVIAPIYDEEGNVAELHKQILVSLEGLKQSEKIREFEIIFVDDGSTDKTPEIMQTLSPLTTITFRKNFGQTAAMDAGIKRSTGDIIITIDGDLQNDPANFEMMLDKMAEGYDVVCGWRNKRKDNLFRMALSNVANKLRRMLLDDGIHDTGCTLKAFKRECFYNVDLQGDMHRFIPAVLRWDGFKITEVPVNHRPRVSGSSKYNNWKRVIKVVVDMISLWFWRKYSARPLHIFGGTGILMLLISFFLVSIAVADKLIFKADLSNTALPLLALFCAFTGVLLFVSGILADILIKTHYKVQNRRPYSVKEVRDNN
jgi:glycosyltransferase involved in cell wall biosynthesis